MKLKNFLFFLTLLSIVTSCKDESKSTEGKSQEKEVVEEVNAFKVKLNVVVKKDDSFCLLYTTDGSLNFEEGVWKEVKGSDGEQTVEFSLPEDVYPTQLRLDLGKSTDQEDITIKSVQFDYLGTIRDLVGPQVGVFFRPDASKCTYDVATGVIKTIEKDGVKQFASLYPHETIQAAELPKLAH